MENILCKPRSEKKKKRKRRSQKFFFYFLMLVLWKRDEFRLLCPQELCGGCSSCGRTHCIEKKTDVRVNDTRRNKVVKNSISEAWQKQTKHQMRRYFYEQKRTFFFFFWVVIVGTPLQPHGLFLPGTTTAVIAKQRTISHVNTFATALPWNLDTNNGRKNEVRNGARNLLFKRKRNPCEKKKNATQSMLNFSLISS